MKGAGRRVAVAAVAACVLAGTLALAALAASDAFVPAKNVYLGGGKLGAQTSPGHFDVAFAEIKVLPGNRVHFWADSWIGTTCTGGAPQQAAYADAIVPLRADGSFSGTAQVAKSPLLQGVGAVGTITFRGKLRRAVASGQTVEAASGTGSARYTAHSQTCKTGLLHWQVRSKPRVTGAARPSGGVYYGVTSERIPVLVRVRPDGTQIANSGIEFNLHCSSSKSFADADYMPVTSIAGDGSFSNTERYDANSRIATGWWGEGASAHYVATFTGKFGAATVGGSFHADVTVTKGGSTIDTCHASATFAASR